jgi:hypothetical protein
MRYAPLEALALLVLVVGCGSGVTAPVPPAAPPAPPPPAPPPPPPPAPAPVYQYGAKFEPPVGRVVHGMGQWEVYNPKYQAVLPATSQPVSELVFISVGDTERPWNPAQIAAKLQQIGQQGRIPLLDIALRGNQPFQAELDTMTDKLFGIDAEVATGTKWDARLGDLVQLLRNYRKPVLARIGGEFSGWWNGYHPWDYPKAFRKIVLMFRAAGVDNVAFVWCYEPAAAEDFDAVDAQGHPKWYPGADVVDWFSIDLFAKGDVSGPTIAHGVLSPYGKSLKFLDLAVAAARPVVIAESAPAYYDLGLASGGQAAWAEWFQPYFQLIAARSEIKWFVYVNYDWTKAGYSAAQGWKNNDLSAGAALAAMYASELAKPRYLHAGEQGLLKDYLKYP